MRLWRTAAVAVALVAAGLVTIGESQKGRPRQAARVARPARPAVTTPWQQVNDALSQGLPKTAIEALGPIVERALKRGDWGEATRAVALRATLEAQIQGAKPEEKITRLQAELAKAPEPMRPILEAILAEWTWQFFQQNRWRFVARTRTQTAPGDDLLAWDLPRIYAEIDAYFQRALAAAPALRRMPIQDWSGLLEKGNVPDEYRPTLYDFIAHQAIAFYASGEQAGARPEDAFELDAESPIFAPVERFVRWEIPATDTTSPTLRALRLLQEVLRFHAGDRDPTALLDADLGRLELGNALARGERKAERYQAALERFAREHADHEISARALHDLAQLVVADDPAEARRIAQRGVARFPKSIGAARNRNLIQAIEAPELSIQTERVWNGETSIIVHHKNVGRVHFRMVRIDFEAWVKIPNAEHGPYRDEEFDALLAKPSVTRWESALRDRGDYKVHVDTLPAPRGLASDLYHLIASPDRGFVKTLPLQITTLWVSRLAIVARPDAQGNLQGFVLDADSGEPVAGANVRSWQREARGGRVAGPRAVTDDEGHFEMRGRFQGLLLHARANGEHVSSGDEHHSQPRADRAAYRRTMFFTDRALYRPGQTIRYKGLCLAVDQDDDSYATLDGQDVTVVFADLNGKEVERARHRTNAYGSFSGAFTAPRDRLLGAMQIRVEGDPDGATMVQVEEYKRPKFEVTLEPPRTAALDREVTLEGKAESYTGAPVDGALVRWRVTREARYPVWWWWWDGFPREGAQEIAHGVSATGTNGRFAVTFLAQAAKLDREDDAISFRFTVHADVVDPAGETRSASRTVHVGRVAMEAALAADAWQTTGAPVRLTVRTTTLDGTPLASRGVLVVRKIVAPERLQRPPLTGGPYRHWERSRPMTPRADLVQGTEGDVVLERDVRVDTSGTAVVEVRLGAGAYRARFEARDPGGKRVRAEHGLQVVDVDARRFPIPATSLIVAPERAFEPGETFVAVWGTGYARGRAFVEVEHRGRILQSYWTGTGRTQAAIRQPVTEAMRGGFTLRVTYLRENRAYLETRKIDVPWSDRRLAVRWERFVSKLEPGARTTWTAVVTGPDADRAVAEMTATLYDASLDAYRAHGWPAGFSDFRQEPQSPGYSFTNHETQLRMARGQWPRTWENDQIRYRHYIDPIGTGGGGEYAYYMATGVQSTSTSLLRAESRGIGLDAKRSSTANAPPPTLQTMEETSADAAAEGVTVGAAGAISTPGSPPMQVRRNLNETAFFFPHLVSNQNGEVRLEFTMPEALTQWRLLLFAHDSRMRAGLLDDRAVTARDLMVQPNPPRFLREGDELEFTVKVTNRSDAPQRGRVTLTLTEAATGADAGEALGLRPEQAFDVPAKESRTYAFRLRVPDGAGFLTYKAMAEAADVADGEEGVLPVLSRRVLVTESLPLPIRGAGTKRFEFARLTGASASSTLRHQSLTLQMTSHPAWYAVMALPYLMEYPYECTEQTFNRLYANALARKIAGSDPKIRAVFERWRGTKALDSPLEKNEDLKSVVLEETPWVRQAASESQARRNVGLLFEEGRLDREHARAADRLAELQLGDGRWPWFPGGPPNEYITLYIVTGYGRLRHLGVSVSIAQAVGALGALDRWMTELHQDLVRRGLEKQEHLSPTIALYLYARSFFVEGYPVSRAHRAAFDYWIGQARAHWLRLGRQSQGHAALALARLGDKATAQAIVRSLAEHAVHDDELGMFWRDTEHSWWWYRAPIETQALMIEAFDEVANDQDAVEALKVWLLKQKQTQDWKTTKATADAVYALILRGTDVLASDALVEVALAGNAIEPEAVEAGTGFYEHRVAPAEIRPELGRVTVRKSDPGVAWGALHWQYLEDMSKITPYEGTPLRMKKTLMRRTATKRGLEVAPLAGPVAVGDELVARIEIRVDRDMEYVHLKDRRGSGVEPVNVISGHRYQDGLAYYEQTKDTATHFFIAYLPKGTYVFEYPLRVQHRGRYQSGVAEIQCMYAPEFDSHSESVTLEVR